MDAAAPPELPDENRQADERTTLRWFLDFYRIVLSRKAWGLDDAQLAHTIPPSDLSLGGLLFHMALVEDHWFDNRFVGNEPREPWASAPWDDDPDWEFRTAAEWSGEDLHARFEESVARSRKIESGAATLDEVASAPAGDDSNVNLRWIMVHMVEEYARHCGHADYLRQSIDGTTGD